uniref:Uncharacterized protein n=1 Tax=Mycena chlorophos TaxID=658473 RepID=A0ABQ0L4N7_MYCCL|nr:predicted protein [Mycena chlorophos]
MFHDRECKGHSSSNAERRTSSRGEWALRRRQTLRRLHSVPPTHPTGPQRVLSAFGSSPPRSRIWKSNIEIWTVPSSHFSVTGSRRIRGVLRDWIPRIACDGSVIASAEIAPPASKTHYPGCCSLHVVSVTQRLAHDTLGEEPRSFWRAR